VVAGPIDNGLRGDAVKFGDSVQAFAGAPLVVGAVHWQDVQHKARLDFIRALRQGVPVAPQDGFRFKVKLLGNPIDRIASHHGVSDDIKARAGRQGGMQQGQARDARVEADAGRDGKRRQHRVCIRVAVEAAAAWAAGVPLPLQGFHSLSP